MALIYHESTGRTQDSMRDVSGCLFIITCELIFTQAYGVMNYYPSQMPILRRETNEHIYQFSAYYVAEIINAIPICIIRSVSGFTITYLLAGFNTGFLLYAKIIVTLLVSAFTANAYGLFVSSFFEQTITELASAIDLIFMCLAGIYLNLSSVSYVRFISPFFFSNEALAILFWHDVTEIGKTLSFVSLFLTCLELRLMNVEIFHSQIAHQNMKKNVFEMAPNTCSAIHTKPKKVTFYLITLDCLRLQFLCISVHSMVFEEISEVLGITDEYINI